MAGNPQQQVDLRSGRGAEEAGHGAISRAKVVMPDQDYRHPGGAQARWHVSLTAE
jgi:hypothetical protein